MKKKVKVARLSIISNTSLIIIKTVVGLISGSVSIISEAIHSFMDLLAAIIAFFSVRVSDRPADSRHPYGHGKFENISGVIEALLIFIAAGWIIYEAIDKLINRNEVESIGLGSLVMLFSAIINFVVSKQLYKVAKETDSIALEADALHLKTDVLTSLGVAIGLFVIWITDIHILDPIIAILVALLILKESYVLLRKAYSPLLDIALSPDEILMIEDSIKAFNIPYHELKTRKAGNYRFAEFHIEMPEATQLKDVHELCDRIEDSIKSRFKEISVTIHVETTGIHIKRD